MLVYKSQLRWRGRGETAAMETLMNSKTVHWLILDKEANQCFLMCAVVWNLFFSLIFQFVVVSLSFLFVIFCLSFSICHFLFVIFCMSFSICHFHFIIFILSFSFRISIQRFHLLSIQSFPPRVFSSRRVQARESRTPSSAREFKVESFQNFQREIERGLRPQISMGFVSSRCSLF